jgi:hypothetical protein
MGVHRERLNAAKAQRALVRGAKMALQKWASKELDRDIRLATISPSALVGGELLSIPVPPMLEEALGYRGALCFVSFGYSPRTRTFGHCDGGDDIPADPHVWLQFLHHPLVASQLPKARYPALYGVFSQKQHAESFELPHCLLLDRTTRQLYICRRDNAILFLSLTEPDEEEVCRIFVDHLRTSPGNENYKVPPPKEIVAELLGWLDNASAVAARH